MLFIYILNSKSASLVQIAIKFCPQKFLLVSSRTQNHPTRERDLKRNGGRHTGLAFSWLLLMPTKIDTNGIETIDHKLKLFLIS